MQEQSHCRVLGQANRPVESIRSLRCFPEPLQAEMATLLDKTTQAAMTGKFEPFNTTSQFAGQHTILNGWDECRAHRDW